MLTVNCLLAPRGLIGFQRDTPERVAALLLNELSRPRVHAGGGPPLEDSPSSIRGLDDIGRIKLLSEDVQIRQSTLTRAPGRSIALNSKHHIRKLPVELLLREQQIPPHPRDLDGRVPKPVTHAKRPHAQIRVLLRDGDAQDRPHLLFHEFLLLLEGVLGAGVVQFGPADRGHGNDR